MLKRDKKKMDKDREEISIEDLIEKERGTLDTATLTKVTLQTFVAWKKKKLKEKADAEKQNKVARFILFKDSNDLEAYISILGLLTHSLTHSLIDLSS